MTKHKAPMRRCKHGKRMPAWGKVCTKRLKQFYKESCHCSIVKMAFNERGPPA